MFNIFKKNGKEEIKKVVDLVSPLKGRVVKLSEVPDQVFSNKMVGDGLAIEPTEGLLVSPVEGVIRQIFPTKHAVGIETSEGLEILIHIGINTVDLNGEGFEKLAQEGDKVKAGDQLIKFDLDYIKENASSIITPILITNMDSVKELVFNDLKDVEKGKDQILSVIAE
ncbi:PTS sugar transporter subunit IIA [Halonatronum saccharophilum]|uniref:PTS sugar transporter subunit IIA n=1 Tax=Halonatronum saccharophilum TaxID=150060 RepID=UPI0004821D15|nr:PTS glucose transporter subunit IIA [Halonatronum saccharophilum]